MTRYDSGGAGVWIYSRNFHPTLGGVQVSSRIMARELAGLGFRAVLSTGTPLTAAREVDEGYTVSRDNRFRALVGAVRGCEVAVLRGGLSRRAVLAAAWAGCRIVCFHEMAGWPKIGFAPRAAATAITQTAMVHFVHAHVGVSRAALATKRLPASAVRSVLYNPVPPEIWPHAIRGHDDRDIDVLFVGRMIAAKGVRELAEALTALAAPVRVILVGDGPERQGLEIALSNGPVRAGFLGSLAGERLRDLYARSKVAVVPSRQPEGMGMVVAEAMANGTPVIASDQPALVETLGEGGLTYASRDPGQLRDRLCEVLGSRAIWEDRHAHALRERERFSIGAYRNGLRTLMTSLVRRDRV